MNEIRSFLLEFIWSGDDVDSFEQCLYEQNAVEFEKLIGSENYLELITFNFKKKTTDQVKQLLKVTLHKDLVQAFEQEFEQRRSRVIKGICVKSEALDYRGDELRNWDVEVGKEYEFLSIHSDSFSPNHPVLVNYVNRDCYFRPSGFVPMELFDLSLDEIPEPYHKILDGENQIKIELKAFSEECYQSTTGYSFWVDFHDDEEHAIDLYFETIKDLGIKDVW